MLDSLVRVSRRVGWDADADATDHLQSSQITNEVETKSRQVVQAQQSISISSQTRITERSRRGGFPVKLSRLNLKTGLCISSRQSPGFASSLTGRDATLLQVHSPAANRTTRSLAIYKQLFT